jgi:hypothetical protein
MPGILLVKYIMESKTIQNIQTMVGGKKVRIEYVKVRAARPGIRPPLILPIPKEIVDQANIEVGETFAIYVDEDKSIRLVRPKI